MSESLNNVTVHCKGLIFDDDGRLLLIKQAESFGTYWNAPGGRMDDGDSLEGCLAREVREETGLSVVSARLAYSHAFVSPGVTDLYMGFHVTEYSGTFGVGLSLTESEQEEFVETRFVARNEKLDHPLFPTRLWDVADRCVSGDQFSVEFLGTNTYADWGLALGHQQQ